MAGGEDRKACVTKELCGKEPGKRLLHDLESYTTISIYHFERQGFIYIKGRFKVLITVRTIATNNEWPRISRRFVVPSLISYIGSCNEELLSGTYNLQIVGDIVV